MVGMMGSGKSAVGSLLARRLGARFLDLDREVERVAGRPVAEIFEREGEHRFRTLEAAAIAAAVRGETPAVIATGGGAVLDASNVRRMRRSGTVVWLKASPEALARRTAGSARPLLRGARDRAARLREILAERQSRYARAAHVSIETGSGSAHAAVGSLLRSLSRRLPTPTPVTFRQAEGSRSRSRERAGSRSRERKGRRTGRNVAISVRVPFSSPSSYPVRIGHGLLSDVGAVVRGVAPKADLAVVITDRNVARLHGARLERSLRGAELRPVVLAIPPGERHKTIATVARLWRAAIDAGLDRRTPIVAFGGGVVGDLAGFVAATALRGVPLVQVPTTVVAQVDSSVGGKTGFDLPSGKNLVGAFKAPAAVVADLDLLETLPPRERRAGMAEVAKTAAIADRRLFARLESAADPLAIDVIAACVRIKAAVVARDPEERGLRAVLNFGHTVGHGIEAFHRYSRWLHGEAVAAGMVVEAAFAASKGCCRAEDVERLSSLLRRFRLPVDGPRRGAARFLSKDKKRFGNVLRLPLLARIGRVRLVDVPQVELKRFLME